MSYDLRPIDITNIILSDESLELTELLAENVHDMWTKQHMSEGWPYGLHRMIL